MFQKGEIVSVYDPSDSKFKRAEILKVRENVVSILGHLYPVLYDVVFLDKGIVSTGHLPHAIMTC